LACYGDFVTRLNRDHNVAEERAQAQRLDPTQPLDPAEGRRLTSYLGLETLPEIQLSERMDPARAECLILASDGLTDALDLVEIGAIVTSTRDAQGVAEALLQRALDKLRPNQDNVSVLVLRLETPGEGA
jgi:serine/threonine protein phosphatase PrpC